MGPWTLAGLQHTASLPGLHCIPHHSLVAAGPHGLSTTSNSYLSQLLLLDACSPLRLPSPQASCVVQSSHQGSATPGQAPTPASTRQQSSSARQSRSRAAAEGAADPDSRAGRTSARLTRKLDFAEGRSAPMLTSTVRQAGLMDVHTRAGHPCLIVHATCKAAHGSAQRSHTCAYNLHAPRAQPTCSP